MLAMIATLLNPMTGYTQEGRQDHTSERKPGPDQLRHLARKILDSHHPPYSLYAEVAELAQLLDSCATVRIDPSRDISDGETHTENGLALSPVMAAMCVQDFVRTVVFIRGLHTAIQTSRNRSLGRPTRVLYVGCGPYAVLAIPSMTVFPPQDVEFTLLDIHPPSIDSARSVVKTFGLTQYVRRYEITDAKRYQILRDEPPDVTVMEIMNACLEKEPQVAITRHLLRQAPQTILVPESIRIDAYLVDTSKEFTFVEPQQAGGRSKKDRIPLGRVFELSRETVKMWNSCGNTRLPAASVQIPDPLERHYTPMLFTTIQVFRNHYLKAYDSGLTTPRILPSPRPLQGGDILKFSYRLGSHPALRCDSIASTRQQRSDR